MEKETSGRGVGLSAVRAVVSEMGGSIQIQTTEGRETELTILFPIRKLRPSYFPDTHLQGAGVT